MYSRATTCTECEMHNYLFIDALGEGGDLARGSVGEGWWCWEVMVCKGIAGRRGKVESGCGGFGVGLEGGEG